MDATSRGIYDAGLFVPDVNTARLSLPCLVLGHLIGQKAKESVSNAFRSNWWIETNSLQPRWVRRLRQATPNCIKSHSPVQIKTGYSSMHICGNNHRYCTCEDRQKSTLPGFFEHSPKAFWEEHNFGHISNGRHSCCPRSQCHLKVSNWAFNPFTLLHSTS